MLRKYYDCPVDLSLPRVPSGHGSDRRARTATIRGHVELSEATLYLWKKKYAHLGVSGGPLFDACCNATAAQGATHGATHGAASVVVQEGETLAVLGFIPENARKP